MANSSHHLFYVAVHAFFIKNNQVMLSERANTGWMDGYFSVPAGHVDGRETIWAAMQREIVEETGLNITQEHQPVHVMHRMVPDHERIDFFFVISDWQGEPTNTEPEKCAQLSWYPLDTLPENIVPYIKKALEHIKKNEVWSELLDQ